MQTRSLYFLAAAGGLAWFILAAPQPTSGQNTQFSQSSPQMQLMIKQLAAQSKEMAENQVQIDAKLDKLAETIRQARLFGARGGAGKGAR